MYADSTLTPKEAVRLCALGTLALGPRRYSALASTVRHFVSHILGPSLDLMGTSIELLRLEGLVESSSGVSMADDAVLELTPKGRDALNALLRARVRAAATEFNRLIVSLKFRFLHLLEPKEQRTQVEMLSDVIENEVSRLTALRGDHAEDGGHLVSWLDHEIALLESRLHWLQALHGRLGHS
ncbi:MAG: hypothetical protein EXQ86_09350 [Rhodospirillales bacterium]|nr:hypothetical protein [Rhodospirillales bacterium]